MPMPLQADVQVVITTSSMESGISYQEPGHFTATVAWAQNCSLYGAPVFSPIQQMFRVRNLKEGRMTVFVSNSAHVTLEGEYPCTSYGVDKFLAAGNAVMLSYMKKPLHRARARYMPQLANT